MTLLTKHIEAGWHEVWHGTLRVAEKFHAQPGASSTVLREEAATQDELHAKIDLRESQLSNDNAHVIWPSGQRVTDAQHSAAAILGEQPQAVDSPSSEEHEAAVVATETTEQPDAVPPENVVEAVTDANVEPEPEVVEASNAEALTDEQRELLRTNEDALEAGTNG